VKVQLGEGVTEWVVAYGLPAYLGLQRELRQAEL